MFYDPENPENDMRHDHITLNTLTFSKLLKFIFDLEFDLENFRIAFNRSNYTWIVFYASENPGNDIRHDYIATKTHRLKIY